MSWQTDDLNIVETRHMLRRLKYREDPGLRRDCNMKDTNCESQRLSKQYDMDGALCGEQLL